MFTERPCMRRFVSCTDLNKPELYDTESLDFELNNVELSFTHTTPIGIGQLFITSKRVIWIGSDTAYDFDVPYIVLHAITKDVESYCKPCIYCQLDCDEPEEEGDAMDEMFLAPEIEDDLLKVFNALSRAALNNPDPPEEGEQEGDDELIFNTDEVELGARQARTLNHLESVFMLPSEEGDNDDVDNSSSNANIDQNHMHHHDEEQS